MQSENVKFKKIEYTLYLIFIEIEKKAFHRAHFD